MNSFAIFLGILAGLIQLAGYYIYNKHLASDEIRPNATSWFLWAIGGVMVVLLYHDLAGDWVKEFLPFVCSLALIATFVHMAVKGSFQRPDRLDLEVFILDLVVVMYWVVSDNPFLANVFLELDIWITFVPIIRSTAKKPETEEPRPWLVWTVAYALFTIVVILRWEKWWDLLLPVNYLILHGIIWFLAKRQTYSASV